MARGGKEAGRRAAGPPEGVEPGDLARRIAQLVVSRRGRDVMVLDLRGLTAACDYFVLADGLSDVHVKALAEHVESELKKDAIRPWHVEGRENRRWILMDYVDVVVHLFHREAREFYRLESLWADAPREEFASDGESEEEEE